MERFKNYLPYFAGVCISLIFGLSFIFIKNAFDIMEPVQILAYRFAVAALVLTGLRALGIIKINLKGKNIRGLLLLTLFQPVSYFIFETLGLRFASSSESWL